MGQKPPPSPLLSLPQSEWYYLGWTAVLSLDRNVPAHPDNFIYIAGWQGGSTQSSRNHKQWSCWDSVLPSMLSLAAILDQVCSLISSSSSCGGSAAAHMTPAVTAPCTASPKSYPISSPASSALATSSPPCHCGQNEALSQHPP